MAYALAYLKAQLDTLTERLAKQEQDLAQLAKTLRKDS